MKKIQHVILIFICIVTCLLSLGVASASEWTSKRRGKIEAHLVWHGISGTSVGNQSQFLGDYQELSNANIFGFGAAYNFNEHLNLTMNMLFGSQNMEYEVLFFPGGIETVEELTSLFLWDWLLKYNALKSRLTPVAMAGFSIIQQNSEQAEEGSIYVNWGGWESTFSFTWGAGGRWDISDRYTVEALYRSTKGKTPLHDFPIRGFSLRLAIKFDLGL